VVLDTSGMNFAGQLEAALSVIRGHPSCPPQRPRPAGLENA
jgi:hypothetical protein